MKSKSHRFGIKLGLIEPWYPCSPAPSFTGGESGARKDEVTCPKSKSQLLIALGLQRIKEGPEQVDLRSRMDKH